MMKKHTDDEPINTDKTISRRKGEKAIKRSDKTTQRHAREALLKAMPFLHELIKPSPSTYSKARDMVSQFVINRPPSQELTPAERLMFIVCVKLSTQRLPGYATLDLSHIAQIDFAIDTIQRYIDEPSQQRPLNILMHASPGAGKSHFIKCIAARLDSRRVRAIIHNMSSMQSNDDLIPPLDAARNLKVEDYVPLLFLDEFDSSPSNFTLLLPLMWDGALYIGRRDLRLGKIIIVLAGSDPSLSETMAQARSMRPETTLLTTYNPKPKLIDLFSRINGGVLSIPPFYDIAQNCDRRPDKVCIAIQLMRQRFGNTLVSIPMALLRFIANVQFRYDVRSIAHLIDRIPPQTGIRDLTLDHLNLPLNSAVKLKESSLACHLLNEDQALGIVKMWEEATHDRTTISIKDESVDYFTSFLIEQNRYIFPLIAKSFISSLQ